MNKMQLELYEQINNSETIINQLSEPAHITAERDSIKKQLDTLRKAEKILKHSPEFSKQTENISDELKTQEIRLKQEAEDKKNKETRVKGEEEKKALKDESPTKNAEAKAETKVENKGMFATDPKPAEVKNMFAAPDSKPAEPKSMFGDKANFFKK